MDEFYLVAATIQIHTHAEVGAIEAPAVSDAALLFVNGAGNRLSFAVEFKPQVAYNLGAGYHYTICK